MSTIGGTIRYGEFTSGAINHVLKINLWAKFFLSHNNNGYRWPAGTADGGYSDPSSFNYYNGSVSELRMGALLALNKNANVTAMGFETTPGKILAKTFQDYGAYVVDNTSWNNCALTTETGPTGIVRKEFSDLYGFGMEAWDNLDNTAWGWDIKRIITNLYVVDNNVVNNIGGGPTASNDRRAAFAPDFSGIPGGTPVKIMPLGDSKTEGGGCTGQSSFRGFLRSKLMTAGYVIDYVGPRSNCADGDGIPGDNDHAGFGGYSIGPDIQTFCSGCETTGIFELSNKTSSISAVCKLKEVQISCITARRKFAKRL